MIQEAVGVVNGLTGWGHRALSCSPQSHALAYSVIAMAVLISVGGVFVWKRYIKSQPAAV